MRKQYQKPKLLQLDYKVSDFIVMSGDGYADDPWSEGFGDEL